MSDYTYVSDNIRRHIRTPKTHAICFSRKFNLKNKSIFNPCLGGVGVLRTRNVLCSACAYGKFI